MTKINDYDFRRESVDAQDFKDEVRNVWNNGKYQFPSGSTVPTYSANIGEAFLYLSGTAGRLYIYGGVAWDAAALYIRTTA